MKGVIKAKSTETIKPGKFKPPFVSSIIAHNGLFVKKPIFTTVESTRPKAHVTENVVTVEEFNEFKFNANVITLKAVATATVINLSSGDSMKYAPMERTFARSVPYWSIITLASGIYNKIGDNVAITTVSYPEIPIYHSGKCHIIQNNEVRVVQNIKELKMLTMMYMKESCSGGEGRSSGYMTRSVSLSKMVISSSFEFNNRERSC